MRHQTVCRRSSSVGQPLDCDQMFDAGKFRVAGERSCGELLCRSDNKSIGIGNGVIGFDMGSRQNARTRGLNKRKWELVYRLKHELRCRQSTLAFSRSPSCALSLSKAWVREVGPANMPSA